MAKFPINQSINQSISQSINQSDRSKIIINGSRPPSQPFFPPFIPTPPSLLLFSPDIHFPSQSSTRISLPLSLLSDDVIIVIDKISLSFRTCYVHLPRCLKTKNDRQNAQQFSHRWFAQHIAVTVDRKASCC